MGIQIIYRDEVTRDEVYDRDLLSDEEVKAMEGEIHIKKWISHAIHEKARRCIDNVITEYSDKQYDKITHNEKMAIVRGAHVKTLVEKIAEYEAEEAERRAAEKITPVE